MAMTVVDRLEVIQIDVGHGDLLAASRRVVADYDLDADDEVVIDAPIAAPGALVAGVLAPMRVGATVLLGDGEIGTVAVGGDGEEERVIEPSTVL